MLFAIEKVLFELVINESSFRSDIKAFTALVKHIEVIEQVNKHWNVLKKEKKKQTKKR